MIPIQEISLFANATQKTWELKDWPHGEFPTTRGTHEAQYSKSDHVMIAIAGARDDRSCPGIVAPPDELRY
jgi:hypothetical protein